MHDASSACPSSAATYTEDDQVTNMMPDVAPCATVILACHLQCHDLLKTLPYSITRLVVSRMMAIGGWVSSRGREDAVQLPRSRLSLHRTMALIDWVRNMLWLQ